MKVTDNFRSLGDSKKGDKRNRRDFRDGRQGISKQQPFQSFCFKRRRPRDEEGTRVENLVRREDRQAPESGTREVSRLTCNCPPVGRNQRTEELYGASQTWCSNQQQWQQAPNISMLATMSPLLAPSLPPHRHRCRQNYNGIPTHYHQFYNHHHHHYCSNIIPIYDITTHLASAVPPPHPHPIPKPISITAPIPTSPVFLHHPH